MRAYPIFTIWLCLWLLPSAALSIELPEKESSSVHKDSAPSSEVAKPSFAKAALHDIADVRSTCSPDYPTAADRESGVDAVGTSLATYRIARECLSPGSGTSDLKTAVRRFQNYRYFMVEFPDSEFVLDNLAETLAHLVTAPLSAQKVESLNELLGLTDAFTKTGVDPGRLADRVNELAGEKNVR